MKTTKLKSGYQWDSEVDSPFATSLAILVIAAIIMFLTSCGTTKTVVEHRYHESTVDTMAVQSIIDGRMQSWHQNISDEIFQAIASHTTEQESSEQERERITETTMSYIDSLGREVKEHQQVTERIASRQWKLREEQIKEEFRKQLQEAIARYDSTMQVKYQNIVAHWEQKDSTKVEKKTDKKGNITIVAGFYAVIIILLISLAVISWRKLIRK